MINFNILFTFLYKQFEELSPFLRQFLCLLERPRCIFEVWDFKLEHKVPYAIIYKPVFLVFVTTCFSPIYPPLRYFFFFLFYFHFFLFFLFFIVGKSKLLTICKLNDQHTAKKFCHTIQHVTFFTNFNFLSFVVD